MLVDRGYDANPKQSDTEEEVEKNSTIYAELAELTKYVEMMTKTIRDMETPVASTSDQLPQATKHLGDLAKLTEEGTHKVLTITEEMERRRAHMMKELLALKGGVSAEQAKQVDGFLDHLKIDEQYLMNIHVALSFQDLVAQRVAKLVTILNEVQHKLLKLVVVFGLQQKMMGKNKQAEGRAYEMLKQLEVSKTSALEQNLVDDILSEFGCS
ncbi:MAG: protein phosphatase CheZ [Nitrospirales bacterium]|nr:protein phosphatase CheZ [Nitrospirales bacterium]